MPLQQQFELLVDSTGWSHAVHSMLSRPGSVAVSRLRRNATALKTELLAVDLASVDRFPQGSDYPPLLDWAVLILASADPQASVADWVERIRPRAAQLLAVVLVGRH